MKYKLNVEIAFVDRYTNAQYKVGDVIEVNETRGNELLHDPRKLVSLNEKIEEVQEVKEEQPKKKKAKE